jgi:c-di-GMP-binding flagellar brake protein YcgR
LNTVILLQEAYQLLNIAPRKSYRIDLRVKCEGTTKGRPFAGHTENVSTAGMLLSSRVVLLEGDIISCSFSLPDSRRLTATAEVVRVIANKQGKETTYGVCFTDISPEAVSAIEALSG